MDITTRVNAPFSYRNGKQTYTSSVEVAAINLEQAQAGNEYAKRRICEDVARTLRMQSDGRFMSKVEWSKIKWLRP